MFLSRLAVLLLLPFLAAALLPWLNAEASPRIVLVTFVWALLIHVFALGAAAGSELLLAIESKDTRRFKLQRVTVMGLAVLWLVAISMYASIGPLAALLLAVAAQLLGMRQLRSGVLWDKINPVQQAFLARIAWVSIGCQLMLVLSYVRLLGGL